MMKCGDCIGKDLFIFNKRSDKLFNSFYWFVWIEECFRFSKLSK